REREMELYGPKKRGPKPKTFLLKAQAKAKAKTYEFRSDSSRGIRVPYPGRSPQELGSTSRAREGLRNIALAPQGSSSSSTPKADGIRDRVIRVEEKPGDTPKKRGPKPRKELYKDLAESLDASKRKLGDPGDKVGDYLKARKMEEAVAGAAKFGSGHSVIQLARRQDPDIAGPLPGPHRDQGGAKLGGAESFPARLAKHRVDFLDPKGQGGLDPGGNKLLHGAVSAAGVGSLYRDGVGGQAGRPSLIARIPVSRILGDPEEESWSPSLNNLEKVVVTDVTSNFLTVTIKESSTDQGFFKEKR
ncbi:CBX8 protein, partial [Upupa epops]|nr:CBX8 protein [Upupa epops]